MNSNHLDFIKLPKLMITENKSRYTSIFIHFRMDCLQEASQLMQKRSLKILLKGYNSKMYDIIKCSIFGNVNYLIPR